MAYCPAYDLILAVFRVFCLYFGLFSLRQRALQPPFEMVAAAAVVAVAAAVVATVVVVTPPKEAGREAHHLPLVRPRWC